MRLYNLEDRSTEELKELLEQVKTHFDLTFEEKKANIEAINSKLGVMTNNEVKHKALLAQIDEGQTDLKDFGA